MATTVKIRRSGTATATPLALEHGEIAINYADGKVFWKDASNVITSFTFQAYALANHTHAASDITSGTLDAARLPLATTGAAGAVIVGTGLGVSSGTVSVSYGTTAGTACQGNDSRLSDTRTPTDGSVTTAKIADDAVTYAKLQNVSATNRLLGRSSSGSGDVEELDAATARTVLSVQPTASPAFTGAATFANTGDVVPVTVTNTGTGNCFVVNDASSDTTPFVIDASGNVGVGTSTPAAGVHIRGAGTQASSYANNDAVGQTLYCQASGGAASDGGQVLFGASQGVFAGVRGLLTNGTGPSGHLIFCTRETTGNVVERVRVRDSGVAEFSGQVLVTAGSKTTCSVAKTGDPDTGIFFPDANQMAFSTGDVERMRIDASGNVLVGTTNTDPIGGNVAGTVVSAGFISVSRDSALPMLLNRKTNDGDIVGFWQDGGFEGSISVSGNTISYNAFCGSHWAQLSDQSRPAILRGTVMETIDEMCDWPEDGGTSDRLVRVKVSDTPASRRVYGAFMAYDEPYASTGDMYVTALGAYMVRVSGVVQSGDLLESAGDGTARTQADDIVRSSTIGKVSSKHRIAEYDDGSYLVPCVLMCG